MNDKLQLHEIAGYLPYGLKCQFTTDEVYTVIGLVNENVYLKELTYPADLFLCKPILRPLSDLIKKIKWNDNHLIPIQSMCRKFAYNEQYAKDWSFGERDGVYFASAIDPIMTRLFEYNSIEKIFILSNPRDREKLNCKQYDLFEYLFKNHFDIHNLIGRGLAIDINTITT